MAEGVPAGRAQFECACRTSRIASWVLQVLAAGILAQTLFFKFTGAEESRYIFSTLGVEPWGRYASGVVELVAAVLLLVPRAAPIGAMLAAGVMVGAIGSHLGPLGIEVRDDGGLLFTLAILVMASSLGILWLRRGAVRALVKCVLARVRGTPEK
ncbi:MAG: DoxX family protein [Planctomycetota bacterium]|nr:DoxX family protein [Planctomycetota bacterium]